MPDMDKFAELRLENEIRKDGFAVVRPFDHAIDHIDRALSEIMIQAKQPQDDADTATLRHHAGDLILSGVAILKRLGRLEDLAEYGLQEKKP